MNHHPSTRSEFPIRTGLWQAQSSIELLEKVLRTRESIGYGQSCRRADAQPHPSECSHSRLQNGQIIILTALSHRLGSEGNDVIPGNTTPWNVVSNKPLDRIVQAQVKSNRSAVEMRLLEASRQV